MSEKFTPGPWTAEPMVGRGAWVKGATGEWAALSCGDTNERAQANASLIAAAPELYDALKAITDCYGVGQPPEKFLKNVHDFMMEGRAALAKARGEAND